MFDIHLRAFERGGLVGLEFPWAPRLISLFIASLLAAATFFDGSPPPVGIVLVVVLGLAGLYQERWAVDGSRRKIDSRIGLIFWTRNTSWSFDEVAGFEFSEFIRGAPAGGQPDLPGYKRFRKPYVRLCVNLTDGTSRVIETTSARHKEQLLGQGQRMAGLCGVGVTSV